MTITEEEKAINILAEVFHPQISNKLNKCSSIKVEYEVKNLFSFIKIFGVNKKSTKMLEIYNMNEYNLDFEDEELRKAPLQFKKLRELKGKWDKCIFMVDKDKKTTIEYIFPEKKMQ